MELNFVQKFKIKTHPERKLQRKNGVERNNRLNERKTMEYCFQMCGAAGGAHAMLQIASVCVCVCVFACLSVCALSWSVENANCSLFSFFSSAVW